MNLNGLELFVETYGEKSNETIVFLNGVMASTSSWKYYVDELKNHYHIVCHDFKGQLKSDKPKGPYSFYEHARDTVDILRTLGVEKAHFIGTSYGGEVGLKLAVKFPEFVRSLIVINSVSEVNHQMKRKIKNWMRLCDLNDGYKFLNGLMYDLYSPTFIKKNQKFLEERAQATKAVDSSYFVGQKILYETFIKDVYMTDELFRISAPALIVTSDKDIIKPPKFSKLIASRIRHSEYLEIKDCGHVTIFEKPKELLEHMKAFLDKHKM